MPDGTDQEGRRLANVRFARSDRTRAILFTILIFTIIGTGWGNDHASCVRQLPVRREARVRGAVLKDFLVTAAQARQRSANHEHGLQRAVDSAAAARWRFDASQIGTLPIPSCDGLLPSTK